MHREYQPSQMAFGHATAADHGHHHHDHDHDHDHEAELRWLVATTAIVGALLGSHLLLAESGSEWQRPLGISLALLAALVGGARVVYLGSQPQVCENLR